MQIVRIGEDNDRMVIGNGPTSPVAIASPPGLVVSVMGESVRPIVRYDAIFDTHDVRGLREALRRIEPTAPTLRALARERRCLWVFCPLCGRTSKVTAFSLADSVGRDASVAEIGPKLRCKKCSHRGAALIPDSIEGDLRQ